MKHLVLLLSILALFCSQTIAGNPNIDRIAADRFESIRPGYTVTKLQQATSRYALPILSSSVTPDRQTLILLTAQHRAAVAYTINPPGLGRESTPSDTSAISQISAIDLAYSLNGVQAHWRSSDGSFPEWNGWLPQGYRKVSQTPTTILQVSISLAVSQQRLLPNGLWTSTNPISPQNLSDLQVSLRLG
jgi:hypothetical protein